MNELPIRPGGPAAVDWLSLERTQLANERTLLAWLRTGLGVTAAGATLLHVGSGQGWELLLGSFAVVSGAVAGVIGAVRFVAAARRYAGWREAWERWTSTPR